VQRGALELAVAVQTKDCVRLTEKAARLQTGGSVLPYPLLLTAPELPGTVELEDLHTLFQPRFRGGLGFDHREPRVGIQLRLRTLLRRPLPVLQLVEDRDDLRRLAERTEAIVDATRLFAPANKVRNKDPKDWERWCRDCLCGCRDFRQAVATCDSDALRLAAHTIERGCVDCHAVFRDD
jgi:hypothetical protein